MARHLLKINHSQSPTLAIFYPVGRAGRTGFGREAKYTAMPSHIGPNASKS